MALQGIVAKMSTDILTPQTRPERSVFVPVNANKYYVSAQIPERLVLAIHRAMEYVRVGNNTQHCHCFYCACRGST